jgi:hypothetical protein
VRFIHYLSINCFILYYAIFEALEDYIKNCKSEDFEEMRRQHLQHKSSNMREEMRNVRHNVALGKEL